MPIDGQCDASEEEADAAMLSSDGFRRLTLNHEECRADADGAPLHPVTPMQEAFEESIMDAADVDGGAERDKTDAVERRQLLLEMNNVGTEDSSRWRRRPGTKFHPLWKLIAQISFGMHLLLHKLAKSEEEVTQILQTHVEEVDGFLEDTTADFDLAIRDIDERVRFLSLPLEHGKTFDRMLREKPFRAGILHGNETIERIIARTTLSMVSCLKDIEQGTAATAELAKYLDRIQSAWRHEEHDLLKVYSAMHLNARAWFNCFQGLRAKADTLAALMARLDRIVIEVSRRAGIASRKETRPFRHNNSQSNNHPKTHMIKVSDISVESSSSRKSNLDKPLPPDPTSRSILVSPRRQSAVPDIQVSLPMIREGTNHANKFYRVPKPERSPHSSEAADSPVVLSPETASCGTPSRFARSFDIPTDTGKPQDASRIKFSHEVQSSPSHSNVSLSPSAVQRSQISSAIIASSSSMPLPTNTQVNTIEPGLGIIATPRQPSPPSPKNGKRSSNSSTSCSTPTDPAHGPLSSHPTQISENSSSQCGSLIVRTSDWSPNESAEADLDNKITSIPLDPSYSPNTDQPGKSVFSIFPSPQKQKQLKMAIFPTVEPRLSPLSTKKAATRVSTVSTASLTALPPFQPPVALVQQQNQRQSPPRKPSLASMKSILFKRQASKDRRLVSGGLGGHVALAEVI